MKKVLLLTLWISFLFSTNSALAYTNFVNLWKAEYHYWKIIWELKKENWEIKTIFLLKDKKWKTYQVFSTRLEKIIRNLYLHKNNVKILWQDYKNPNNKKYAWIFVRKIWNLDLPTAKKVPKKYEYKTLSEDEKIAVYQYLTSNKFRNKYLKWKKIFWNVNLKQLYKEMSEKDKNWKVDKKLFSFIKYFLDKRNFDEKNIKKMVKIAVNYNSLDKKILDFIENYWDEKIKNIFKKVKKWQTLTKSEKFIFNELNTIDWFENFLDLKISAKEIYLSKKFSDKFKKFSISKEKNRFVFQNISELRKILNKKEKNISVLEFFNRIEANIILNKINRQVSKTKNLNQNFQNSEKKLNDFFQNFNTEKIKKTAFSRDFTQIPFWIFKINLPHNFDYQQLKIWNEVFLRLYFKDFYSNILKFDFNKVEKFSKINWPKTTIKIAWNYWSKIVSDNKITYQISNKNREKFEISFSTREENFKEIFENILSRIEKK